MPRLVSTLLVAAAASVAVAQQPEQAHISLTGIPGQISLDYMAHDAACSVGWGAEISTTPDFTIKTFVPAYACDDFTAQESMPTYAVRVLFTGLTVGTTYYYVAGSPNVKEPGSQGERDFTMESCQKHT
jgi:hypothetical protein